MSLPIDFIHELRKQFSGNVRLDLGSRVLYSTDASMYQIEPLGVAIPKTQDDLQSAVELAAKYKVPILPRGAGTSLGGQSIGKALVLDCSRWLDAILEIDPQRKIARVEPGVVLSALNADAANFGLIFGPDPASAERATMGGVIGNNATGAHSILYGMTADHLVSADVILGDGTTETWDDHHKTKLVPSIDKIRTSYADAIKEHYPKTWRNSAGYRLNYLLPWSPTKPPQWDGASYPAGLTSDTYNVASLLAGSEGTLAVMQRATVNLVERPKHTMLGVLSYQSIAAACDDVPRLLEFKPSAIELIPKLILRLARSVPAYAQQMGWLVGDPSAILVVEFSGDELRELKNSVRHIGDLLSIAESRDEQTRIWNVRKVGLGLLDSQRKAARPVAFIEDCAIPVEHLGDFVREVERILSSHGISGGIYAHASAGCLHIRPILNLQSGEGVRALRSIARQVLYKTLQIGGSMSSEHGDGIASGEWIEKTYGNEVTEAMRLLKSVADPDNLLNPKKLFDAPPMDSHLRFGENYSVKTWGPTLAYDHERGLAGAIEQCNGQGVCLKRSGVMCPSFQATREEQNSTRGRANLLRAMISQQRPDISRPNELMNSVFSALDLCLACKGCKAECPSGVDMAKIKYEFENLYYKSNRRPLRDYVFGYFSLFAKFASLTAPTLNVLMANRWIKNIAAKIFGITAMRPYPRFVNHVARPINNPAGKKIIYLPDPFSRYVEPEVEQAVYELLYHSGYNVQVLPSIGAGASLMSKGFIREAKRHAARMLDSLQKIDPRQEFPIVGIEPPEIYMLKNDYSELLTERKNEAASISTRAWLLDEYLLRSDGFNILRIGTNNQITNNDKNFLHHKVAIQPHCHQRAESPADDGKPNGADATYHLLHLCGYEPLLLDAGCCGMAGTFGFESEHYDLSIQVGELKLFPALRGWNGPVACTGAACRMQIHNGLNIHAVHPVILVRDALFEGYQSK